MIKKGDWVYVYPCTSCDNILPPVSFDNGDIYKPCQNCGGNIGLRKSARRIYDEEIVTVKRFFGLLTRKERIQKFIKWELKK